MNNQPYAFFASLTVMTIIIATGLSATAEAKSQLSGQLSGQLSNWGIRSVEAQQVWERTSGNDSITVAVIDTGIDTEHPDLKDALWVNPKESGLVETDYCKSQPNPLTIPACNKATNGIDDDGNGLIDDIHGWNFAGNNNRLEDIHGHGTHISGIIAATGAKSFRGVAPVARLMVLKYYDAKAPKGDPVENTIKAIDYAVKMGAHIINYSAGGKKPSPREEAAIKRAQSYNVLFVAAAGNEGSNSDVFGYFPAGYKLSNILSVTAMGPGKQVLSSSNFGLKTVHLAAPGESILSTLPGGKYGVMTGTSQATAFASGVAALLMASRPGQHSPESLIHTLVQAGDTSIALKNKTLNQTYLNARKALAMFDTGMSAVGTVVENANEIDPRFVTPGFETTTENRGPATTQSPAKNSAERAPGKAPGKKNTPD